MASILANAGRAIITSVLATSTAKYVGMGTGAGTAAATDTTLFTEVETRTAGTQSQQTTSVTSDTYRVTGTVAATTTRAITNAGVFDASTTGNLLVKGDFATINLANGDSIAFTFNLQFT
jgi:multidrug efflux pump subunit AcrA (membrane-fusion protein)